MPIRAFPVIFVCHGIAGTVRPRIRFGSVVAKRLRGCRRPRRMRQAVNVLTTSGTHVTTLASITLYGAILEGGRRLKQRELVALRLPSGERVKARVRWRLGRRCGISFLSPAADFARILRESNTARAGRHWQCKGAPRLRPQRESLAHWLHGVAIRARRLSRRLRRWCRSL
jgi:hypothetical protein